MQVCSHKLYLQYAGWHQLPTQLKGSADKAKPYALYYASCTERKLRRDCVENINVLVLELFVYSEQIHIAAASDCASAVSR